MTVRNDAYRFARFLGDVEAIQKGRVGKRLWNRFIGRAFVSKVWWK